MTPAFLDGKVKGLFIDGQSRLALSGKTFESISPRNGERLALVAQAGKEDVDLAVAAARRAFDGEWSRCKPFDRQQLMLKLADLVDKHYDELALLDTLDMGGPISRTRSAGGARWRCCATTPGWRPRSRATRSRTPRPASTSATR